jgi:hypothetical protein
MTKTSKAPSNFYNAADAAKRLGMPKTTFHAYVRQGKIKKVVPPGRTEGFYPKKEIDKLARARELFILEYASEPSTFAQATDEDIKGIHDLCVSLFGVANTASYETLLSWHKRNPRTYYVVKQEGIVTGYIGFLYLNEEVTQHIMSESVPGVPSPPSTEVLPFTPGKPIHGLWVGLAVRPGLPSTQARYTGRHLLAGAIEVLENLAREGMPVKKLYATTRTSDGIKLGRKLGFREIIYPDDPLIRYEADLEKSDSPLLSEYKKLVKRYEQRKTPGNP